MATGSPAAGGAGMPPPPGGTTAAMDDGRCVVRVAECGSVEPAPCAERKLFLNSFVPVLTRRGPRARNACVIRDAQSGKASWHACAALSASARSPRERERLDPISNFQIRFGPQLLIVILKPYLSWASSCTMSSCQVAKTTIIRVFLILIGIGAARPQGPKHLRLLSPIPMNST